MNRSQRVISVVCGVALFVAMFVSIHNNSAQATRGLSPPELLAQAIDDQDLDLMKAQLSKVDINGEIISHCTPLMLAVMARRTDAIRLLVESGANVNQTNGFGWTALHVAASTGDAYMVDLLLQHGADPNLKANKQITALILAAQMTSDPVVRMLLGAGADPRPREDTGRTAESVAEEAGDHALAEILRTAASRFPAVARARTGPAQ
ncbi:MAG TPA: ankyrin repeat domain-containing protein [Phycisphaerae bacterium]|nr:ankyrin repeat domain-containing protein [Phycisphaerae bacterium]